MHAGSLNANISLWPEGKLCLKALKKELHAGLHAIIALRDERNEQSKLSMRIGIQLDIISTISKNYELEISHTCRVKNIGRQ